MTVTIITPTADQPTGIRLLETYVARQTIQPDQWIVADDGDVPAKLTMGQQHIVRPRRYHGALSLAYNLLAAIEAVKGNYVIIFEHDDWYAPNHIQVCIDHLNQGRDILATGSMWLRYYHVGQRKYILMRNRGSALCNTAMRAEGLERLASAARRAILQNNRGIDNFFWESVPGHRRIIHQINTVVGIKGLPGRAGLGIGHRPDKSRRWQSDPKMARLGDWIGGDRENYSGLEFSKRAG